MVTSTGNFLAFTAKSTSINGARAVERRVLPKGSGKRRIATFPLRSQPRNAAFVRRPEELCRTWIAP
jgi:hypothetical protein